MRCTCHQGRLPHLEVRAPSTSSFKISISPSLSTRSDNLLDTYSRILQAILIAHTAATRFELASDVNTLVISSPSISPVTRALDVLLVTLEALYHTRRPALWAE
jgi:hypothetical protein